jgi:hypothetical protein
MFTVPRIQLELWFSNETEELLRDAWAGRGRIGLRAPASFHGGRPHIALATTTPISDERIASFAPPPHLLGSLSVHFGPVSCFLGPHDVFALTVLPDPDLLRLHRELFTLCATIGFNPFRSYVRQMVYFYTVLCEDRGLHPVSEIIALCNNLRLPVESRAAALALVAYGPARVMREWSLRDCRV